MKFITKKRLDEKLTLNETTITLESHLNSEKKYLTDNKQFDIFLSHSMSDKEVVLKTRNFLNANGYQVYIDWLDDTHLERENVNSETAALLQKRMQNSKALLFLTTENYSNSKWMPWECGYFEGIKNKVAIFPVLENTAPQIFKGQEYLGLYPIIQETLFGQLVVARKGTFVDFKHWVNQ